MDDFKLYINRKTARSIGLSLPESILLRADRVFDWPLASRAAAGRDS